MVDWIGGLHWRIGLVDRMVDWIGLECRAIIIYLDANVFFSDVARNHNYSEFLPKHIKAVSAMRWLIQRQGKHVQCWWHLVGLLWLRYCSYLCHGEILTQFIEILEKIQWNPQILSRLITHSEITGTQIIHPIINRKNKHLHISQLRTEEKESN